MSFQVEFNTVQVRVLVAFSEWLATSTAANVNGQEENGS